MSKHCCLQISFRVKLRHPLDSHRVWELQPHVGAMAELCVGRGEDYSLVLTPHFQVLNCRHRRRNYFILSIWQHKI